LKNYLLFFTLFCFISCTLPTEPQFLKVSNVEVKDMSFDNVTINSFLHYHNPNNIKGQFKATDITVTVNDIDVGNLNQLETVMIPSKSNFSIPVTISFPPKDILKKKGLLKSVLQAYANDKVALHYLGTMTFTIAGKDFKIPIDFKDDIILKK